MRIQNLKIFYLAIIFISLTMFTPILAPHGFSLYAQSGNSISGHVFGLDRQPLTDVYVELLDDLNRTIARTRTNGSGRYSFYGLSQGRFRVRAMPLGTNYEEKEEEVEIQNFTSQSALGGVRTSGFSNEQRDFYLRLRKGATAAVTNEAVFVQEVPEEAKKLYEKAISDLNEKKEKEGFEGLKSALEIFPKYYAALERLGLEYVRLGHFEASQILLTMAVDVNPRSFKSWYGLAHSLYSLKRNDEALKAVQKAIEINASSPEALLLAGVLNRQKDRFEDAEKQLTKAKELSNGSLPDAHWQLALLYYYDLKRYRDAAKELKLFLKVQPNAENAEEIKKLIKELEEKAEKSS